MWEPSCDTTASSSVLVSALALGKLLLLKYPLKLRSFSKKICSQAMYRDLGILLSRSRVTFWCWQRWCHLWLQDILKYIQIHFKFMEDHIPSNCTDFLSDPWSDSCSLNSAHTARSEEDSEKYPGKSKLARDNNSIPNCYTIPHRLPSFQDILIRWTFCWKKSKHFT